MAYSRRDRINDTMSREDQEDLAYTNAKAGISVAAIADMLDLTHNKTKDYIHAGEVRATANKRSNLYVVSPDDIKKSQQA